MYRGLTALMATSALVGCQQKLITEPSSRHQVVRLETPYNEKGVDLDEFSPDKHTRWKMKAPAIYGTAYEAVRNTYGEEDESGMALRPVLASRLRTDASKLENRLVSEVVYVGRKIKGPDGKPSVEWVLDTEGKYGVKAKIKVPNLEGTSLAIWNIDQTDVSYDIELLKLKTAKKDDKGIEREVVEWYAVPLISNDRLPAFDKNLHSYLKGRNRSIESAPEMLPFTVIGPLSLAANKNGETVLPNSDVDFYTGQVTLLNEAFVFTAMSAKEFEARFPKAPIEMGPPQPKSENPTPTGSIDPEKENLINAILETVKIGSKD